MTASLASREFMARRDAGLRGAQRREAEWEGYPKPILALMNLQNDWMSVARVCVPLARWEESLRALQGSFRALHRRMKRPEPDAVRGEDLGHALILALMSGDSAARAELASAPLKEDSSLNEGGRGRIRLLQAFLRGDAAEARVLADRLEPRDVPDAQAERRCPGEPAAVRALLDSDAAALRGALETLLDHHVGYAGRGHHQGQESALICPAAILYARLARQAGLDPKVDARFHAVPLKFKVRYLQDPAVKPGTEVEIAVDLLPDPLLG